MTAWDQALSGARTRAELVSVANDYLATWTPQDVARLPPGCRPSRIRDVDDIRFWVETLSETCCSGNVGAAESGAIRKMLAFLLGAAARVGQIHEGPDEAEGPPAPGIHAATGSGR